MNYRMDCTGNCCYRVFQQKSFLWFKYWSFMCDEPTFESAKVLIENLTLINKE